MAIQVTWSNYMGTGQSKSVIVYSLDADTINAMVPDNISNGNYRIFRRYIEDGKSMFDVIYVGRVAFRTSDRGLKDRLLEHEGEWTGDLFFDYNNEPTALAAYRHECRDYHGWKSVGQAIHNNVHPAKIPNYTEYCPICGQ